MNFKFSILMLFLFFSQLAKGQDSGFYYKYDFQQYLISKTKDSDSYLEKVKESINYPAIARENAIEGQLIFLLINHGNNESEIILKKHGLKDSTENVNENYMPYLIFENVVKKAFEKVDIEFLKNNNEKFIIEFSILFDMYPFGNFSESEKVDFIIQGKEVKTITTSSH